ncbi:MAG TPA: helix-turn-helix domain-containing protein [Micromonosporaceae bacterium]|nr:helix-turn-helix domain-containing protein [Micromonosporaceae bacterium]
MRTAEVENLWDIHDVARYLRVPVETLYQWRKHRTGPPAGRHLRYDPTTVRAWFKEQEA